MSKIRQNFMQWKFLFILNYTETRSQLVKISCSEIAWHCKLVKISCSQIFMFYSMCKSVIMWRFHASNQCAECQKMSWKIKWLLFNLYDTNLNGLHLMHAFKNKISTEYGHLYKIRHVKVQMSVWWYRGISRYYIIKCYPATLHQVYF